MKWFGQLIRQNNKHAGWNPLIPRKLCFAVECQVNYPLGAQMEHDKFDINLKAFPLGIQLDSKELYDRTWLAETYSSYHG